MAAAVTAVADQTHPAVNGAGNSMTCMTFRAMTLPTSQQMIAMPANLHVGPIPVVGPTLGHIMSVI